MPRPVSRRASVDFLVYVDKRWRAASLPAPFTRVNDGPYVELGRGARSLRDAVRAPDDGQELGASARIGPEMAEQLARDHRDAVLAHATRRHALVRAFHDDTDALRFEHVLNAVRDLGRHGLLHLEPAGKGLDDACELAYPDDFAIGQIADMDLADDRRHVVLAVRFEAYVAQHDHLVVAVDLVERAAQKLDGILTIAAEPVLERARNARRGSFESLAVGVVANPQEQRADCGFGLFACGSAHGV